MPPRRRLRGLVRAAYTGYIGRPYDDAESCEQVRVEVTVEKGWLRVTGEPARLAIGLELAIPRGEWQDPGPTWGSGRLAADDALATIDWLRDQGVQVTELEGLEIPDGGGPPGCVY